MKTTNPHGPKMGAPVTITEDIITKVYDVLKLGNYKRTAYNYVGVTQRTFENWEKRGRLEQERIDDGKKPLGIEDIFLRFYRSNLKAIAQAQVRDLAVIYQAAETSWQAAAWKLERRHPKEWGRRDMHDIESGGSPLGVIFLPAVELAKIGISDIEIEVEGDE